MSPLAPCTFQPQPLRELGQRMSDQTAAVAPTSALFDAYYFATGCGRPYQHDDEWMAFFGGVAARIQADIQPQTVLDAGCAMGLLVESLRDLGVEAYGVDLSDHAISQVSAPIAPYCRVADLSTPLDRRYDLIVSIEVLEHMPPAEADRAIANLCASSDDILFSSTPFDYKEATHLNVRMPEAWAEAFARHGFFRDVDYDASYITPWAVRFRRTQAPLPRRVREYERRFWQLWKENVDLRQLALEQRHALSQQHAAHTSQPSGGAAPDTEALQGRTDALQRELDDLTVQHADLQRRHDALQRHLHEVSQGRVLRTLNALQRLLQR